MTHLSYDAAAVDILMSHDTRPKQQQRLRRLLKRASGPIACDECGYRGARNTGSTECPHCGNETEDSHG